MASSGRQLPGLSCEECRRRKVRCDRVQPRCGTCAEMGIECLINDKRKQRGPKKGQIKSLRSRVAILESRINGRLNTLESQATAIGSKPVGINTTLPSSTMSDDMERNLSMDMDINLSEIIETDERHVATSTFTYTTPDPIPVTTERKDSEIAIPEIVRPERHLNFNSSNVIEDLGISDLIWADLDLLYFDRVHPVLPMIHKRRYFAWSCQEILTPAHLSLRLAMGTLAAAVSTQFPGLSNMLYTEIRRILETPDMSEQGSSWMVGNVPLEMIQAWLLVAHYELMCIHENRAMITAGRAFRLVQLSQLQYVDTAEASSNDAVAALTMPISVTQDEGFAEAEERRRTFWIAFSLDRFLGTGNEWPLTLQEEMTCPRLPSPETYFQNNVSIEMDFLPGALTNNDQSTHSPFTKCIINATLYGRCAAHRRLALASSLSTRGLEEFWTRHKWLASVLERQTQVLTHYPANILKLDDPNPVSVFSQMLGLSAIIHLFITIDISSWHDVKHQMIASAYGERATQAAGEIAHMVKEMPKLFCFEAHPFLPNILSDTATFLMKHTKTSGLTHSNPNAQSDEIEQLLSALRDLSDVNNLARDLLIKLQVDKMHTTQYIPDTLPYTTKTI
ncbi:fungal-specific transcription factor domain-containing protein [Annulohypoxylon moriforme]|nr:fungal-specific transcription factor domain-containing protein [Annulohypoxylon moriforme]